MAKRLVDVTPDAVKFTCPKPSVSPVAEDVWESYVTAINDIVPLSGPELFTLGFWCGELSDLNYKLCELPQYDNSVAHAVRNLGFAYHTSDKRWAYLQHQGLPGPILDWGCGVGFFSVFLSLVTGERVYAHDLPGAHFTLAKKVFPSYNVKPWNGEKVSTVVSYNVLEHFPDPLAQLTYLRTLSPNVYANLDDTTRDLSDKADPKKAIEAIESLYSSGHLLPKDGSVSVKESYADLLR